MNELTGSSVFRAASRADAKAAPMTGATGESAATGVSSMEQGMVFATANGLPPAQGLYDSRNEHDACGVGFVANMHNAKSHELVRMGLQILLNLDHRGAVGADPKAGDGCGLLMQIPHRFFVEETARLGFALPEPGLYAVGALFMPRDAEARKTIEGIFERVVAEHGQVVLGWRDVPVDPSGLGETVKPTEPAHRQIFIGRGEGTPDQATFERKLFLIRKIVSNSVYALHDPKMRAGIRSRCPR